MPKKTKDFTARVDFYTTDEMRCQLIAIGYLMGAGGEYATPARNLLKSAIDAKIETLSDADKMDYLEIYKNVLIREGQLPEIQS